MSNIDALARDWLAAKRAEQEAQERRVNIERELAAALDVKDEGSATHKLEEHKVTLTQPVRRTLDCDVWESVKYKIPEQLRPVKTKLEPDVSGIKWLENNEPNMWASIAPAFTSKKGKISVKVENI